MSRRASLFAKENPGSKRPQVSFPDELVFLDNIKENDMEATYNMLRRASVTIDINALGDAGRSHIYGDPERTWCKYILTRYKYILRRYIARF